MKASETYFAVRIKSVGKNPSNKTMVPGAYSLFYGDAHFGSLQDLLRGHENLYQLKGARQSMNKILKVADCDIELEVVPVILSLEEG